MYTVLPNSRQISNLNDFLHIDKLTMTSLVNIPVYKISVRIEMDLLVEIAVGFCLIQCGTTKPISVEKPRTNRFLDEFRLTYWRLDKPTAVTIPENSSKNVRDMSHFTDFNSQSIHVNLSM